MITDAQSYIKLAFTGAGNYTYNMVCRDEAHLSVYHIDSEGSSTKLLTTQYSITLGTGGAGGTVVVSDAALTAGFLYIKREVPLSQTINLTNSSRLDMELLERGLDTNVMLLQQIRDYVATSTVDIPWRGEWSGPGVSYTIRDLAVAPDGDWHISLESHTSSSSFSVDLAAGKWLLWIPMSSYSDVTTRVTELETNLNYNEIGDNFGIDITGNAATATTAAACSGNAATATTAAACSGNAATATTAEACSGNAATATRLATTRTIGGVSFDGSASISLPGVNAPGNQNTSGYARAAKYVYNEADPAGIYMTFRQVDVGQNGGYLWCRNSTDYGIQQLIFSSNLHVGSANNASNAYSLDGYAPTAFKMVAAGYSGIGVPTLRVIDEDNYSYSLDVVYSLPGLSGGWRCLGRGVASQWRLYIFEREY